MQSPSISAVALCAALALTGCDQPQRVDGFSDETLNVEMLRPPSNYKEAPAADAAMAPAADAAAAAETAPAAPAEIPSGAQIAYSYRYGVEVPADRATDLMRRHEAACTRAGPLVCQVLESESRRYGRDSVTASLELRAAPAWLTSFRATLEADAEQAGGRIAAASTESEDLTRSLTDTAARLRALTTLRDRLQVLLATRSAPLEQLLATERELARVQGELDGTQSALTAMRTRVAMSHVSLSYQSAQQFAPDNAFTPVKQALTGSLAAFMGTLGAIIYALATLLPLFLILGPLIWLGWKHRRKIRVGKKAKTPPAVAGDDGAP
ncbi:DUF4349 domain-containing protein [Brevundimonas sp. LjRoot202]|uniref:DUF4349 domain-containing protein n=1 Tax=Brevundimonas sp. LjRoot202 TaxID=3342281 RepID=UPI003ECC87D4